METTSRSPSRYSFCPVILAGAVCTFTFLSLGMAVSAAEPMVDIAGPVLGLAGDVPLTGFLPPARFDQNQVTVYKRPAVPFVPFELMDPATRQKVSPDTIISLPSGKKVKAGDYYAELNRLEQSLNQLGYSFRDQPNRAPTERRRVIKLQENRIDPVLFKQQADAIARDHLPPTAFQNLQVTIDKIPMLNQQFEKQVRGMAVTPRGLEEPPTPEEKAAFLEARKQAIKDQALAERLQADRELGIEESETDLQDAMKEVSEEVQKLEQQKISTRGTDSMSDEEKEAFATWRASRRHIAETSTVAIETQPAGEMKTKPSEEVQTRAVNPALLGIQRDIFRIQGQVHRVRTWDYSAGNSIFSAYLRGKGSLDGYPTMVNVHGDGQAGGTVVGANVEILNADGTISVPQSGNMTATLSLTVVGTTVLNLSKSQTVAFSQSGNYSRTVNKSTPSFTIWLGPVPLSVKAGIQGSAGIGYTVGFYPIRAYATLGPTANVNGFAQAGIGGGIGIIEASAGVRGVLVLVKDSLTTNAYIGIVMVSGQLAYQYGLVVYNDLTLLAGQIQLYAEVSHPCFPDFWNTCSDEWDHDLWNWAGIRSVGYLVNEVNTTPVWSMPVKLQAVQ
jgi:hypothetical protein